MSFLNKVFRVIEEDEELLSQFPEFVKGSEFKVLSISKVGESTGMTSVQFKNGPYVHVKTATHPEIIGQDSWFWCFYSDEIDHLEELEELSSDQYGSSEDVPRNLFNGKDITAQLYKMAGQENCDSEEYDLMQAAADYIRWLESQLEFNSRKF